LTDRPISFIGPMIRALLEGRKTQTRRVLNKARVFATPETRAFTLSGDDMARALQNADRFRHLGGDGWFWEADAFEWQAPATRAGWMAHIGYAPGDRLWVREAWRAELCWQTLKPSEIPEEAAVFYEADDSRQDNRLGAKFPGRKRPSMFMPRWAARLTLIVTDVRVQRLQDIGEEDAASEGLISWEYTDCDGDPRLDGRPYKDTGWHWEPPENEFAGFATAVGAFRNLWDSLNAKRGYEWEANPWVVAITFETVKQNIDQIEGGAHG